MRATTQVVIMVGTVMDMEMDMEMITVMDMESVLEEMVDLVDLVETMVMAMLALYQERRGAASQARKQRKSE